MPSHSSQSRRYFEFVTGKSRVLPSSPRGRRARRGAVGCARGFWDCRGGPRTCSCALDLVVIHPRGPSSSFLADWGAKSSARARARARAARARARARARRTRSGLARPGRQDRVGRQPRGRAQSKGKHQSPQQPHQSPQQPPPYLDGFRRPSADPNPQLLERGLSRGVIVIASGDGRRQVALLERSNESQRPR